MILFRGIAELLFFYEISYINFIICSHIVSYVKSFDGFSVNYLFSLIYVLNFMTFLFSINLGQEIKFSRELRLHTQKR